METRPVGAELIHAGRRTDGGNRRSPATMQTHLKPRIRTERYQTLSNDTFNDYINGRNIT